MLYKVWPDNDLKKFYMAIRILKKGHKKEQHRGDSMAAVAARVTAY